MILEEGVLDGLGEGLTGDIRREVMRWVRRGFSR